MPAFIDHTGREWAVNFTIGIARRLKRDYRDGVDILDPLDLQRIATRPLLAYGILWKLCEVQAIQLGIDKDAFDELLANERQLHDAICAMFEAIEVFSRRHLEPVISQMAAIAKANLITSMKELSAIPGA